MPWSADVTATTGIRGRADPRAPHHPIDLPHKILIWEENGTAWLA